MIPLEEMDAREMTNLDYWRGRIVDHTEVRDDHLLVFFTDGRWSRISACVDNERESLLIALMHAQYGYGISRSEVIKLIKSHARYKA